MKDLTVDVNDGELTFRLRLNLRFPVGIRDCFDYPAKAHAAIEQKLKPRSHQIAFRLVKSGLERPLPSATFAEIERVARLS
jgi:hypothetical protein